MSKTLRNISPRWPQCTSHPEPKCPRTRQWSNTSSAPCNCPWPSICWTTIYQCSAPTKAIMKLASPCKALAQSENLGNQSNSSSNLKAANLGIGKSREDAMRAFRHPSLGQTDAYHLLESEAHHHKISPVGTGRLIAMVGVVDAAAKDARNLQILFGLVLAITPRTTKNKNELPATRIHRQCNPKAIKSPFSRYLPLTSLPKTNSKRCRIGTLL